jgi:nitrogen PTS system EIIA component
MTAYGKTPHFDLILPAMRYADAHQALNALGDAIATHLRLPAEMVCEKMQEQNLADGAGIGEGVALSHFRLRPLKQPFLLLCTLARDITDFKSSDTLPVSVIAAVASPAADGPLHLQRLARVSRTLKNPVLHKRLQETSDEAAIRSLLIDPDGWFMAA